MSEIIIYYRQMHVSGLLINWNFVKLEYFLKKIVLCLKLAKLPHILSHYIFTEGKE